MVILLAMALFWSGLVSNQTFLIMEENRREGENNSTQYIKSGNLKNTVENQGRSSKEDSEREGKRTSTVTGNNEQKDSLRNNESGGKE